MAMRVGFGNFVSIPKNASAFGAIVISDGKTSQIVPLFVWTDDTDVRHYGYYGGPGRLCSLAKTQEELIERADAVFKKKEPA